MLLDGPFFGGVPFKITVQGGVCHSLIAMASLRRVIKLEKKKLLKLFANSVHAFLSLLLLNLFDVLLSTIFLQVSEFFLL